MANPSSPYPKLMFNFLWFVQGMTSLLILIFFYVTWATVNGSPVLLKDFSEDENSLFPTQWRASWFLILV